MNPPLSWVLARQGTLADGFNPHRSSVGPKGDLHYLLVGDGDAPDVTLVSYGVEHALGARKPGYCFDVFPDGRICIATFPSKRDDNDELNAAILAPDGSELVRFHIGYGYEDIQVGPDGRIWVSYFDEGVFSGGDLAGNGLNAFDDTGAVVWRNDQWQNRIDDCYALNVAEDAWHYAYSDFNLCHVDAQGKTTALKTPIAGAHAFAIHGDQALFAHQYRETLDTAHLASLSDGAVSAPRLVHLSLEGGAEIPRHGLKMRGGYVHVFAEGAWYRGHLSEIAPA